VHHEPPITKTRSPIVITPLPDPSVLITLRNVNGGEIRTFKIFTSGEVDAATAASLKHFLRCHRTGREHAMAPGLLAMLVTVAQQWPGHVIEVISAFRAPPFGAPHSKHFIGRAIDFRIDGVKTTRVRDFIWAKHRGLGLGYYRVENFVHMDWRPRDLDFAWSSDREGDAPRPNPRWAWAARHPRPRAACEAGCS